MIIIVSKQTLNTQLRKHSTAFENKTWFKKGMRETLALTSHFCKFPKLSHPVCSILGTLFAWCLAPSMQD